MVSAFHRLQAAADRATNRVNGEAFLWTPMRAIKNGAPVPDLLRSTSQIVAIFENQAVEMDRNRGEAMVARDSATPMASIIAMEHPPKTADRMQRAATLKIYEITSVNPDGMGRIYFEMIEV